MLITKIYNSADKVNIVSAYANNQAKVNPSTLPLPCVPGQQVAGYVCIDGSSYQKIEADNSVQPEVIEITDNSQAVAQQAAADDAAVNRLILKRRTRNIILSLSALAFVLGAITLINSTGNE